MLGLSRSRGSVWIAALAALVVNTAACIYNVSEMIANDDLEEHSRQVLVQLTLLREDLANAESGQRGYLLTADDAYLEPFNGAQDRLHGRFNTLAELTRDDPDHQRSLTAMQPAIAEKLAELNVSIVIRRFFGREAALAIVLSGYGKERMDAIRALADGMSRRENVLLAQRTATAKEKQRTTILTTAAGGLLTLGITGMVFILIRRELSRRRSAEQRSRDSERILRNQAAELAAAQRLTENTLALLDSFLAHAPIGLGFLDKELRFVRVNRRLAEADGLPMDAYVGCRLSDLTSPTISVADLREVLLTREALADRIVVEASVASERRVWQTSYYPVLSAKDELLGVGVVTRDITQRQHDERALRASQARFRSLAESIPQKVWTNAPNGSVDYCNQRWTDYTGFTAEQVTDRGWVAAIHPEDREIAAPKWRDAVRRGVSLQLELRVRRALDGEYRWHLAVVAPMFDPGGRMVQWVGSLTDIDDRKRQEESLERIVRERTRDLSGANAALAREVEERKLAEENERQTAQELLRSNRELEQFAFIASHDLQEPLRKILAFGDRLHTKYDRQLGEQGQEYLDRITKASARMRKLIEDLLSFSRLATRAQPFVSTDLGEIVQGVLSDLEERLRQSAGRVEVGPLPKIAADPSQMQQLFLNLIGNALKFHKPGVPPTVTIRGEIVLDGSEFCRVEIADNGIGFDERYSERIFQIFQRLHGRHEYEGTGIGLAICRKIVERHSGTITASSVPGGGAKFVVLLPVQPPEEGGVV